MRWPLAAAPLLALAGLLALAPRAGAGGDSLQLAVCGPRLWFSGQRMAAVLDAHSGRVLHRIRPRLEYPVAVACSGEDGYRGSVINGFGPGAVRGCGWTVGRLCGGSRSPTAGRSRAGAFRRRPPAAGLWVALSGTHPQLRLLDGDSLRLRRTLSLG